VNGALGIVRWQSCLGLGSVLFVLQIPFYRGYLTDDTFIYARFAQNLARTGQLVFNPGEPVHAVTSPLWAALAAVGVRLGADAFWMLKALGLVCALVSLAFFARLAARWLGAGAWALLATAMLVTEPWFVRWSCSGMETPLAAAVVLAMLEAGLRAPGDVARGRLGLAAGLAPLVRPELVVLSGLVAALALREAAVRRAPRFWLGLIVPFLAWAAYAWPTYGALWPQTIQAKSTPLGLQPARLLANLRVLASIFVAGAALPTLAVLAGVRTHRFLGREPRELGWLTPVAWVWVFLLPAIYLVRDVQVISRYLEVVLPPVVLLGAFVMAGAGFERRLRPLALLQVAVALVLTITWISPSTRAFSRTIDIALGDIAGWLAENSEEDELVAIYDIGLVGYRSNRPILDLGGLVAPGINDLRDRVGDEDIVRQGLFLRFGNPRYLVHRDAEPRVLAGKSLQDVRAVPILDRTVSNLGVSRADPVVYTLYRLDPVLP
jgi:hypothetical protein